MIEKASFATCSLFSQKSVLTMPIFDVHLVKIQQRLQTSTFSNMHEIILTCTIDLVPYYNKGHSNTYTDMAMSIHDSVQKNRPIKKPAMCIHFAYNIYIHTKEDALQSTLAAINVDMTGNKTLVKVVLLQRAKVKPASKPPTVKATYPGKQVCVDISWPYISLSLDLAAGFLL